MIIDTSALVAILKGETEASAFIEVLRRSSRQGERRAMSAANLLELTLVIDGLKNASLSAEVDELLMAFDVTVVDVTQALANDARVANRTYGRGFHPAKLNFGDCFSYALAQRTNEPLLFKGQDFARTDVIRAI